MHVVALLAPFRLSGSPTRWTGQGAPDRFGGAGLVRWRRTGSVAPGGFGDTGPAPTKLAAWSRATPLSMARGIVKVFVGLGHEPAKHKNA